MDRLSLSKTIRRLGVDLSWGGENRTNEWFQNFLSNIRVQGPPQLETIQCTLWGDVYSLQKGRVPEFDVHDATEACCFCIGP
jgi:hypothetical protein